MDKDEKSLKKILEDTCMPKLIKIQQKQEKMLRKAQLELIPRKRSARIQAIQKQVETRKIEDKQKEKVENTNSTTRNERYLKRNGYDALGAFKGGSRSDSEEEPLNKKARTSSSSEDEDISLEDRTSEESSSKELAPIDMVISSGPLAKRRVPGKD